MKELIDKLHHTQELTREEFLTLLSNRNTETDLMPGGWQGGCGRKYMEIRFI